MIVHWISQRQTEAAASAHEAELTAATMGTKVGMTIRRITAELTSPNEEIRWKLDQDNQGTIRSILYEVTSWRTRHYADKAAWLRDTIKKEGIEVGHIPGTEIIADPLTQVLDRLKLVAG